MGEEGKPAFGPEVRAEVDALVEQLSSHSDVLVVLARCLADRGGAIDAEATAIDPGGIDLSVRTGRAVDHARLEFPGPVADLRELQGGLMGLVAEARARAGDAEPLTGLERELAETATLPTHVGTVVGSRPLTAKLVEVSVGGLDGFEPLGFDEFVYVMMARPADVIADGFTMADYQAQPLDGTVAGAYYTVRPRPPRGPHQRVRRRRVAGDDDRHPPVPPAPSRPARRPDAPDRLLAPDGLSRTSSLPGARLRRDDRAAGVPRP